MRGLRIGWGCLGCLAIHSAADAQGSAPEFVSAHPELLLTHSQSWGELGFDTAAHEPRKAGEPLRIGTRAYTNGLGHHASGRLVVLLAGEFERFEAEVGLQPGAGGGSVRFRVLVDGRKLFDSGVMRTGDAAKPIRVAVVGAQELTLEADNAGDGITCDMANWADARLVRSAIAARSDPNAGAVNLARFAEVIASDPSRKDGARAGRLQEYHAEDVFLETELPANADGTYTLASTSQSALYSYLRAIWQSTRIQAMQNHMDLAGTNFQ